MTFKRSTKSKMEKQTKKRAGVNLTCVKKSCLKMWSKLGLSSGVFVSRLAISCLACGDREEGME